MKEVRIELKIKNNILYTEIMRHASNVSQFCVVYGFSPTEISELLRLKVSPWSKRSPDGWRKTPKRLAKLFKLLVEDLFPMSLYMIEKTEAVIEVSAEMLSLGHHPALMIESPEDHYIREETRREIREVLSMLRPRDRAIVCDRFGIGEGNVPMTLRETGKKYGVSSSRINQIEKIGIRKLRRRMNTIEGRDRYTIS